MVTETRFGYTCISDRNSVGTLAQSVPETQSLITDMEIALPKKDKTSQLKGSIQSGSAISRCERRPSRPLAAALRSLLLQSPRSSSAAAFLRPSLTLVASGRSRLLTMRAALCLPLLLLHAVTAPAALPLKPLLLLHAAFVHGARLCFVRWRCFFSAFCLAWHVRCELRESEREREREVLLLHAATTLCAGAAFAWRAPLFCALALTCATCPR